MNTFFAVLLGTYGLARELAVVWIVLHFAIKFW